MASGPDDVEDDVRRAVRASQLFARNKQWAAAGPYTTPLDPNDEARFRGWVAANNIPVDPNDPAPDYDMRGYWQQRQFGQVPGTKINPNDNEPHYPDTFKTPYHESFSAQSMYANPGAPIWINDSQLADAKTGAVLFDEKAK